MHPRWVDIKYVNLLSSRLDRFKKKESGGRYTANFRCPFCGDSHKNKFKARGWIYEKAGKLAFKCFNCGQTASVSYLIKTIDQNMWSEYKLELLREGTIVEDTNEQKKFESEIEKVALRRIDKFDQFKKLKKISQLHPDHPAKKYVEGRLIPPEKHYKLYYCSKFYHWINEHIPNKFSESMLAKDEPRLVIPFLDASGYVIGVQGRAFGNTEPRYVTIMFDRERVRIYGLEDFDKTKPGYIVEGPIDSLFLPNCLAIAGSNGQHLPFIDPENTTIVYDNEPRNAQIVKEIEDCIMNGYKVCLWPHDIKEKDINAMVLSGLTKEQVQAIIDNHTYSGLAGQLHFMTWRRD